MEECFRIYSKHISTGKIFFTGQQRLFDPRYIKVMEMIHAGTFGEINAIRTFWNRNGDWRREVPSPDLERLINWRLYREYSKGLMTELACHQLQNRELGTAKASRESDGTWRYHLLERR